MTTTRTTLNTVVSDTFTYLPSDQLVKIRHDSEAAHSNLDMDQWHKMYQRANTAEYIQDQFLTYFKDDGQLSYYEWQNISPTFAVVVDQGGLAGVASLISAIHFYQTGGVVGEFDHNKIGDQAKNFKFEAAVVDELKEFFDGAAMYIAAFDSLTVVQTKTVVVSRSSDLFHKMLRRSEPNPQPRAPIPATPILQPSTVTPAVPTPVPPAPVITPTAPTVVATAPLVAAVPAPKISSQESQKIAMQKRQLEKELDKEIAENSGVLAALRDDSTLDAALGATGLNADTMEGIGGLIGSGVRQVGSGGLGGRGVEMAGGGTADGLGGLGTKGRGSGASGYGSSGAGKMKAPTPAPKIETTAIITTGDPAIQGAGLTAEQIGGVLVDQLKPVSDCYQKEFKKNPNVGKNVQLNFTIGANGKATLVSYLHDSSIFAMQSNSVVGDCLVRQVKLAQFKKPSDGQPVKVSYDLLFEPT